MTLIGAHLSTAAGLDKTVVRAKQIGCDCLQIFGGSTRQWNCKLQDAAVVKKFKSAVKEQGIGPIFLHAAYLVNLASPDETTRAKSIANLATHLQIAEQLGAQGLIFHPGSSKGGDRPVALNKLVAGMREVLKRAPGQAQLIIENTAGGGNKLGEQLTDLKTVLELLQDKRVRICFDTAHAFEAGILNYEPKAISAFFKQFNELIGLTQLVALHANDSKTKFASHHDQHANIGQGFIGLAGFKNLARESRVNKLPWLLETPGFDEMGPDAKNVALLNNCFTK